MRPATKAQKEKGARPRSTFQRPGVPLSLRADLVLTAGICEEFIYRGFAIEELGALAGSRWLAALVSLIFFTLPHARLYGFSSALILPAMLMHAIVDGIFVILVPMFR